MLRTREYTGELPYTPLEDENFQELFFQRAARVREELPELYWKVYDASREILRIDHYPNRENFTVEVCPVKVMNGSEPDHPILLTYYSYTDFEGMLYWPLDMLPLSCEERHDIWHNFVVDDDFYYQTGQYY